MAQFGRTVADVTDGAWLDQAASNVNMFDKIDEVSASDADFIESELNPSASAVAFNITTTLEDPVSSTSHILRWRRQKDASGGGQIDLTIELRMAYISEGSQGTSITSQADADIPTTWTSTSYTLSGGEADAITDYTDLQFRMVANQV